MLTHKKLLEEFIHFEKDNDLYEWEIENIPIWELIRIQVFNDLKSKNSNKTLNVYKKNKHRSIMLFFRFLKNSICYNPFKVFKHKTYLIFNHPRRKYNAGVFEDIYIDPFLPYLSKDKYIVLEGFLNSNIDHYRPVKTENLYYLDIIQLPSRILSNFPTNINLSALDKNKIHEIENAINQNWNTQIFNLEKKVVKYIKRWKFVYPKFIKLIKRTRPKKIILVISYSFLNQIIVYSAKQLRIPVIELQHGIVGKFHIAYNYMNSEKLNIKTFPSHFFAWGKNWIKDTRMPIQKENIKIVGFPYFDAYRSEQKIKRNLKQILILSSIREDIALFARQIAEKLPEYEIIYKAHPAEYHIIENEYLFLKEMPNIKIVADDSKNLYDLFRQCNFVLGVNSTAIIECLGFCPNVFIIKLSGWEYFEDLEESNNLKFISNIEEAIVNIREYIPTESNNDITNYFEVDSIKKICNLINQKEL